MVVSRKRPLNRFELSLLKLKTHRMARQPKGKVQVKEKRSRLKVKGGRLLGIRRVMSRQQHSLKKQGFLWKCWSALRGWLRGLITVHPDDATQSNPSNLRLILGTVAHWLSLVSMISAGVLRFAKLQLVTWLVLSAVGIPVGLMALRVIDLCTRYPGFIPKSLQNDAMKALLIPGTLKLGIDMAVLVEWAAGLGNFGVTTRPLAVLRPSYITIGGKTFRIFTSQEQVDVLRTGTGRLQMHYSRHIGVRMMMTDGEALHQAIHNPKRKGTEIGKAMDEAGKVLTEVMQNKDGRTQEYVKPFFEVGKKGGKASPQGFFSCGTAVTARLLHDPAQSFPNFPKHNLFVGNFPKEVDDDFGAGDLARTQPADTPSQYKQQLQDGRVFIQNKTVVSASNSSIVHASTSSNATETQITAINCSALKDTASAKPHFNKPRGRDIKVVDGNFEALSDEQVLKMMETSEKQYTKAGGHDEMSNEVVKAVKENRNTILKPTDKKPISGIQSSSYRIKPQQ